jgi:hypothetical protein
MRLLERNRAGQLSLTKDLIGDDIPKYAILSYTWGVDIEEVTFKDMMTALVRTSLAIRRSGSVHSRLPTIAYNTSG